MREFKVGDKVVSKVYGEGEVLRIDYTLKEPTHPILVSFPKYNRGLETTFTKEGMYEDKVQENYDIKHINTEKDMKCTTQAEVFTELARVAKLIEGTELSILNTIKYKGELLTNFRYVYNSKPMDFTFALALVEGKPVFAGDKLWSNFFNAYKEVIGIREDGCLITKEPVEGINGTGAITINNCTWKQPKKTFMLNGIELPCPTATGDTTEVKLTGLSHVNDNPYFLKYELLKYRWDTVQDRDKVLKAITDLLDGVA